MMKAFRVRVLHLLVAGVAVSTFAIPLLAQQQNYRTPADNALVRLLESKGILTSQEAAAVSQASSTKEEANHRLAQLLLAKGMITQEEYNQTVATSVQTTTAQAAGSVWMVPAVLRGPITGWPRATEPPTAAPAIKVSSSGVSAVSKWADILPGGAEATTDAAFGTIGPEPAAGESGSKPAAVPAFAPVRVLPVGLMGRESVKPVINAGAVHIQPYGFFKANIIEDSSNPFSGDAPLPGILGENPAPLVGAATNLGPDANPQFHLNARASRFGANFEWMDDNARLVITAKLETDFEGNFTQVFNRGISSIRSSNLGLRLAYGRLDYHVSDNGGFFTEFGQNWTLFCSSTLPSSNETTLLGVGFGSCYERLMQARFGVNHKWGNVQLQPEFALAYPALGNGTGPTATTTTCATPTGTTTCVSGFTGGSQLSIGERSGADSNRPEYESRIALQFPLDKAPGVAPAQLIVSGVYGKARLLAASGSSLPAAFRADFPGGASTEFKTWGFSGEAQLPTRWFTLQGKWWSGGALRYYFVDNLLGSFNPTASFLAANPGGVVSTVASISGEGTAVAFGCTTDPALTGDVCPSGNAQVLPQMPVRGVGGFGDLGLPLSRWFHANPKGRNAGWTLDLGYNVDQSKLRDLVQAGVARYKNDWSRATLNYKLNSWVQIGFEESYYRSLARPGQRPITIDGLTQREWKDLHEQISTIFYF